MTGLSDMLLVMVDYMAEKERKFRAVRKERENLEKGFSSWIAVFSETDAFPEGIITVSNIRKSSGNIAGVAIPVYEGADFARGDYDLYETPLWVDIAANHMEKAMSLDLEAEVLDEQVRLLEQELHATSQRVNLFEKVKINFRPVLIEGVLETSYPSSTTLLVTCVMPTAIMQFSARIKNQH